MKHHAAVFLILIACGIAVSPATRADDAGTISDVDSDSGDIGGVRSCRPQRRDRLVDAGLITSGDHDAAAGTKNRTRDGESNSTGSTGDDRCMRHGSRLSHPPANALPIE